MIRARRLKTTSSMFVLDGLTRVCVCLAPLAVPASKKSPVEADQKNQFFFGKIAFSAYVIPARAGTRPMWTVLLPVLQSMSALKKKKKKKKTFSDFPGLNRGPPAPEAGALSTELKPQFGTNSSLTAPLNENISSL